MRRWSRTAEAAAVVVLVGWAALRVARGAPATLWLDDAWLALVTKADGLGEIVEVGVTAPGYAVLLRLVHAATGAVEGLVHVALVAALVAPVVVHLVGRRALRLGPVGSLAAAAVVASAPVLATYSGRVKPFTTDVVLAAVVLGAAARVLAAPLDRRRWALLAAAGGAAVAMSAATAPTVAGSFLVAAVAAWRADRGAAVRAAWPAVAGGAVFAALWWAVVLRPATNEGLRRYWEDFHTLARAPDAAAALLPLPGAAALTAIAAGATVALLRRTSAPRLLTPLLLAPLAVTSVVAVAGLQPLGGGRTDAHLLPAVALLLGAAVDVSLTGRARLAAAAAAPALGLVATVVVRAPAPEPYPAEDLGSLVASVESVAEPGDRVLVYSSARWAYALESTSGVDLVDSETEANGFEVQTLDPRTAILPRLRDRPDQYPAAVAAAVGSDADVAWLLVSHPGPDLPALEEALGAAGFAVVERHPTAGAELSRWVRT